MEIVTDKFSQALDNQDHMFDINMQNKIMLFFVEHLLSLLNAVGNKLRNYKFKSVNTDISYLKTGHLIDDLRLEFTLQKKEDKDLVKLFF
jgi:hypothetical protein